MLCGIFRHKNITVGANFRQSVGLHETNNLLRMALLLLRMIFFITSFFCLLHGKLSCARCALWSHYKNDEASLKQAWSRRSSEARISKHFDILASRLASASLLLHMLASASASVSQVWIRLKSTPPPLFQEILAA